MMRLLWLSAVGAVLTCSLFAIAYTSFLTNTLNVFGLVLALLGVDLAVLFPLLFDWWKEPDFEVSGGPPVIFPEQSGGYKILKLCVRSKRNFVRDVIASVKFLNVGNSIVVAGKWDEQPIPSVAFLDSTGKKVEVFQGWLTTVGRKVDIPPRQEALLGIAVKHPNEPGFYAFDSWSYNFGLRRREHMVANQGEIKVEVTIQSGDVLKEARFIIHNSSSICDFCLRSE